MTRRPLLTGLTMLAAASAASCVAAPQAPSPRSIATFSPAAIEAHVRFLAADEMEGREAGTRGYDLAANYVATQFQLLGLAPAGMDDSYFQTVPLTAHWLVPEGVRFMLRDASGASTELTIGEDFVPGSSASAGERTTEAPAAFAGYGVVAPEFGHDDYAGLDVDGRIAVVLAGYPSVLPGEEGAHYGSTREKARAAAARGAVGLITVYTESYEAVSPWARVQAGLESAAMTWSGPDGEPFSAAPGITASALMSPEAGARLFEGSERSYADVRADVAGGATPAGFPLAASLAITVASRQESRTSANVVGMVPGSDPALSDEYVVMLGHLDHEGVGAPVDGDAIYNGALDNASGIAALIEAARAVAAQPVAPRRSILFLAVTAEEKGLLGSEYFARNPTVPTDAIVAAVNVDMPVLLYDFADVIAFGADHSSLGDVLAGTLAEMDLALTPDPMPQQAIFTRSDHYRFVQQGVPSVMLATGWNTPAREGEGGEHFLGFLGGNYHQPMDDLDQPIDYVAGARFAEVNYRLLRAVADAEARPAWHAGDFFGAVFGAAR
jgi:Zn-dependent M28 family amino/carboxypeptidase